MAPRPPHLRSDSMVCAPSSPSAATEPDYGVVSIHHVGILCENLERSIALYHDILGIKVNLARPNDKLSYKGAWLWVGSEMIHLMELPNPDPGITKQIWAASVLIVQFLGY